MLNPRPFHLLFLTLVTLVGLLLSIWGVGLLVGSQLPWMPSLAELPMLADLPAFTRSPYFLHLSGAAFSGLACAAMPRGGGGATRLWIFFSLAAGIPVIGGLLVLGMALGMGAFNRGTRAVGGRFVAGIPGRPAGVFPDPSALITSPLISRQHRMSNAEIEAVALGVAEVPIREATQLLQHYSQSQEVGVELFARGALRERREELDEHLRVLEGKEDRWSLRGVAELCRRAIVSGIVPEQEIPNYARLGEGAAARLLEDAPTDAAVVALRAEMLLALGEHEGAGRLIDILRRLPGGEEPALDLGSRLLFEKAEKAAATGAWTGGRR